MGRFLISWLLLLALGKMTMLRGGLVYAYCSGTISSVFHYQKSVWTVNYVITPTLAKVAKAPETFQQKFKWKPLGQESS